MYSIKIHIYLFISTWIDPWKKNLASEGDWNPPVYLKQKIRRDFWKITYVSNNTIIFFHGSIHVEINKYVFLYYENNLYSPKVQVSEEKKVCVVTCSTFREKIRQKCWIFSFATLESPHKSLNDVYFN